MLVSQMLLTKAMVVIEQNSRISHSLTSKKRPDFMLRAKAVQSFFLEFESVLNSTLIRSLCLMTSENTSSKLLVLMSVSSVYTLKVNPSESVSSLKKYTAWGQSGRMLLHLQIILKVLSSCLLSRYLTKHPKYRRSSYASTIEWAIIRPDKILGAS